MKKSLVILVLILTFSKGFGQKKTFNNWFFGQNGAITFNTSPPTSIPGSALITNESCGSVSDSNGVLLFYSDGINVYNKNNVQMPNGFGLNGHQSTTQGAFIIPYPKNPNLYYLFTMDAQDGALGGTMCQCLSYSIIDMSLQGGLGDVTAKNTFLYLSVTEKMTAVQVNDTTVWMVAHEWGSNAFLSYKITRTGLNPTPIVSTVGSLHCCTVINADAGGQMKISSNGKKLGCNLVYTNRMELFDFDVTTGSLSNFNGFTVPVNFMYGFEFSPDAHFVYATNNYIISSGLYQFDMTASSIASSMVNISNSSGTYNALQLGPDGKIYVSENGSPYLSVVNQPNNAGSSCNFVGQAISVGGKCVNGLPNMVMVLKEEKPVIELVEEPYIPNVFSPNQDGINDVWGITFNYPDSITEFQYSIYNRWGICVFSADNNSTGPKVKWDGLTTSGSLCNEGIYFYTISFKGVEKEVKRYKGNLTLVK